MNGSPSKPGPNPDRVFHVVIVGGGITGLASAFYLQQQARQVGKNVRYTLLEASPRFGGKIVSQRSDGFLIEGGPDCFLTRKPWALSLCREVGLESDLLGTNDRFRRVYVLNRGRLFPLPEGVMLIVPTEFLPFATSPLISIPGKLRMAMDLFIPPRLDDRDESLASFVHRRLGREALDKIAEPLLSGIHVSDPSHLSLRGSFPTLVDVERKHGSLIRGMISARRAAQKRRNGHGPQHPMFLSLKEGMQSLVDRVASHLDDNHLRTGCPVETIVDEGNGHAPYRVLLEDGDSLQADAVILATSSHTASRLLQNVDTDLSRALKDVRYVSSAVLSLGYRDTATFPAWEGFGFLVPRSEKRHVTASTWTSTKFDNRAPAGRRLLRCFVGGPGREADVDLGDEELLQLVLSDLKDIMALEKIPDTVSIFRWFKTNPQYDVGHLERVAVIRERAAQHGNLYLAGCDYDGVGVPDCVRQGKEAAERLVTELGET